MQAQMTTEDLNAFLDRAFPHAAAQYRVEAVTEDGALLRLSVAAEHLRPGGTVSGPAMFGLADVAMYMAILARIGPKALTVTTNCSIDFMRKPAAGRDMLGRCRLLKLGRALAVGDVILTSEGDPAPVARASLTYSIPPAGSRADVAH